MADVKFASDSLEVALIRKIAARAVSMGRKEGLPLDMFDTVMDVSACHANGCPLRLEDLLDARDFDFWHDILGIRRHLDRKTGGLLNCFRPRFAAPVSADAA